MFYSYELMRQKNKRFGIIWRVVHQPKKIFTRKDLIPVNLEQACKELVEHIPSGLLSKEELDKKFSLYLLSMLLLGIVIIYSRKLTFIIKDLDETLRELRPEIITFKTPVKAAPKKRKAVATVDDIVEEEVAVLLTPKKLRNDARLRERDTPVPTARLEDITLREEVGETRDQFDSVNAMVVFGQEDLAPMTADDREMLDREISAARLLPVDSALETLGGLPPQPIVLAALENEFSQTKILLDQEVARYESPIDRRTLDLGHPTTLEDLDFVLKPSTPILHGDYLIEHMQQSFPFEPDSGILLESMEVETPVAKRRKHRNLMIDKETYISNEQMREQITDYLDIMRLREEIPTKIIKEPPLSRMLNIRPLRALDQDLLDIFDSGALNVPIERLTFQAAQHMPLNERFPRPDAVELSLEESIKQLSEQIEGEQKFSLAALDLILPKLSIADLLDVPPTSRPPSVIESDRPSVLEVHRRQIEARSFEDLIWPPDVQIFDELEKRQTESFGMPHMLPPLEIDINEPILQERLRTPSPALSPLATFQLTSNDLLQKVTSSEKEIATFSDIIGSCEKNEAAKIFYNLLVLLAHNKQVKVKQNNAGGKNSSYNRVGYIKN